MHRKTVVVDFDGTITMNKYPWVDARFIGDEPVPGALDFIKRILENPNYDLKIHSSRSHQRGGILAMLLWFKHWYIREYGWATGAGIANQLAKGYNIFSDDDSDCEYFPKHKPPGWVNLDDRTIQFTGLFPTFEEIDNFKPWNENLKEKSKP